MINRASLAFQQMAFLFYELKQMNNTRWWRWFSCWFSTSFWAIASYRLDRFFYLLLGRGWSGIRIILSPIFFLFRPWFGISEIHYRAEIGKGLIVLHPDLGVVISSKAIIGDHLTLVGGNCIGGRKKLSPGDLLIGDHVSLGANAVILGPVKVGNYVEVGAGAVVVKDVPDHAIVAGVPAVEIALKEQHVAGGAS